VLSGTPTVTTADATYTITATNAGGSGSASVNIAVLPKVPAISYAGTPYSWARSSAITAQTPSNTGDAITSCSVSPALPAGLALSSACVVSGTPTALAAAATYTISATNDGGTGTTTVSITVVAGAATKLAFVVPTAPNTGHCSGAYTAESRSDDDDASAFGVSRTVNLTSSATGPVFYSNSDCSTPITSLTMSTSAQGTFYLKSNIAGTYTLTAAATSGSITNGTVSVTVGMSFTRIDNFSGAAEVGGYVDATAVAAKFSASTDIASDGTYIYQTDTYNNVIRKIEIATGVTTTLAGFEGSNTLSTTSLVDAATGGAARFNVPSGIVYDSVTGYLYVSDSGNCAIRRVHPTTGETLTIAGSYPTPSCTFLNHATGTSARFYIPRGLTVMGGALYVVDSYNHRIRKIVLTAPYAVTTAAGAGVSGVTASTLALSRFNYPTGIANDGTHLYVMDTNNNRVRKVDLAGNTVTNIAGTTTAGYINNATGTTARFSSPRGIAYSSTQNALYIGDYGNHAIRKVDLASATFAVTTFSGTNTMGAADGGTRAAARYYYPWGITLTTPAANEMFVWEYSAKRLRKVGITTDTVNAIAGSPPNFGAVNGTAAASKYYSFQGSVRVGNYIYASDAGNHCIRRISMVDGSSTTYAGSCGPANYATSNGSLTASRFNGPQGLLYDGTSKIYVADSGNSRVRVIDMTASTVGTYVGSSGGNADGHRTTTALLNSPTSLAFNADKSIMYISDSTNAEVKALTIATDMVASWVGGTSGNLDGTGTAARFTAPQYIVSDGTNLYVTDSAAHNVRKIVMSSGVVTTLAGPTGSVGAFGTTDGVGTDARFNALQSITYDGSQYLYVVDRLSGTIRKIDKGTGATTTIAGGPAKLNEVNGLLNGTERFYMAFDLLYTDSGLFVFGETNVRWIH
jgi:sugar lactone lactonase YvrE